MAGTVSDRLRLDVNAQEGGSGEQDVLIYGWNVAETVIINKTTDVNGDVTQTTIEARSLSVAGDVTTPTNRRPWKIRALKYLLRSAEVQINPPVGQEISQVPTPFPLTFFLGTDVVVTETTQATVDGYTGITITPGTETVTLNGAGANTIDSIDRLYDRLKSYVTKAASPPIFDLPSPGQILDSTDKQNYTMNFDLDITLANLDGKGRTMNFATGKELFLDSASANPFDLTVNTCRLGQAWNGFTLDNFNVSGTLDITNAGTWSITLDGGSYNDITADTPSIVTINLVNGATINGTVQSGITVNNQVTLTVRGAIQGSSVKLIADETVGTVTKGDVLLEEFADSSGEATAFFNYEPAFNPSGLDVILRVRNQGIAVGAFLQDFILTVDQTEEANSNTASDMTLLPAAPVANQDWYEFGALETFGALKLEISQALAATSKTLVWEYWNGTGWSNLPNPLLRRPNGTTTTTVNEVYDNTGTVVLYWDIPGDWTTRANGGKTLFPIRIALTAISGFTTQPQGRKCELAVSKYLPLNQDNVITDQGLTALASQTIDTSPIPWARRP